MTIALPAAALLNGSVADDGWPAGSSLTETWTVVSGPAAAGIGNPNTTVTAVTFSLAGTYVLRLTASDGELSNSDELVITVDPQNQAPLVDAGLDQTVTLLGQLNLSGMASDDGWPRNGSLTVNWSQVSGPGTATIAHPGAAATSVSFNAAGVYVLRLTASDSQLSTSDDLAVTVIDPRVPPLADFVVPESSGTAGSFVIASSGPASGTFSVDKILDNNIGTVWATPGVNNQFAKLQFFDQESVFIDRVRLQPANGVAAATCVRDFDVQVSSTDSNDASFVTVLSATLLNNGQLQEFVLPGGPTRARYLKFVPKNNYGSASSIQLGTFTAVAVGSADSIISLPGQTNAALSQSPGLIANGATIYSSSDPFGSLPPNGLLGYRNGGWSPSVNTHPFAVIQLAGGGLYSLSGIKLATGWNFGSSQATAVRNFEVWVSATTPDDASFTRVLAATAIPSGQLYTFIFPGGKVAARYVKYVPLTNNGGPTIDTQAFDVIAEGTAQPVSASSQNQDNLNPAEAAFDNDVNSIWFSQNNAVTNVWVKTSLADGLTQKLYGVRINPVNDSSNGQHAPRDFEIRVSTTTADDGAFTTVYSGTLASVLNGGTQEFLFPDFVDAKYLQFFWKNGYSNGNIGVRTLEVLAVPNRGSALVAFSTQEEPAGNALDLDPGNQWVTAFNNPTNQWLKLLLPKAELRIIRHIALRPAIAATHSAPKDFEFQVSTTDAVDTSFTTMVAGTLANSTQLQDFYFPPAPARYVRLLLKNNYGGSRFGLASFYVYSVDQIGTRTRFIDRSTDADDQLVTWVWNFGDGATSTERNPLHTYTAPGDYTVSLTVTDSSGLASTHQALYHVLDSLAVDFSASPQIAHEGGEQVRFTDITRLLEQPTALRQYDFGDGVTLSQALNTSLHQFAENGTYHVTLNIGDPLGVSYTATRDIVVLNVAPAVDIPNGKTVMWGETWTSVPTITDQSVLDRLTLQGQWNFGDGQTAQCVNCTVANATATHAYSNPGTYSVTFAVTDRDGGVGSDSAAYVVNRRATSITFLANSLQGSGQTFLSRVKLSDSFDNSGIPNRAIQFNLNGTTGSVTTDAGGTAEITLPISANANVAMLSATWAGDGLYLASNNTASTTLNFAPTVNAGFDQAITLPCGVSLNGSVTDDGVPSGIPLGILWAKISGPGNVAFADAGAAQTTATFNAAGKYVLRLTGNDTRLQSSDDITVTVNVVEVGTSQYFAPVPYLSFADSPLSGRSPSYFYLETFEDHLLNTPGVTAGAGGVTSVIFGSNLHDSIDADDGVIDGSGLNGDSYINVNGAAGIRFNFNATVLGSLPTHAGLVWTDGGGQVYFEAFDHNGFSMGLQGPFNFPDAVNNGTTAEDRFLGAYNKDGISAIRVLNTVGGLEIDHLQYGFSVGNSPPIVNAGNDQNIALPTTAFTLNGVVTDDGLPACNTPAISWSFVSGPGAVSFANAQSAQTTVTLTTIGQYILRLTAGDSQYTASDDVVINLLPPNHAPVVNAGDDQAITLPANTVSLHATAIDDGQPPGSNLAILWSVLSAPAAVTFASANALNTTASFSEPGTYVLRLAASDSQLIATDDLVVVVNASLTPNQPPGAAAGPDQTIALHGNLIVNSSAEQLLVNNELPGWNEVQGSNWTQATINSGDNFPEAQRGNSYFFANEAAQAELRQDVDVSAFSKTIDAGTQQFELKVYLRSAPEAVPDIARVIIEYRNAANSAVIAQLDSGPVSSTTAWHLTEDIRSAPAGTGWVRVRLIATRNSGTTTDAFFDSISLRPVGNVAIKLAGVVSDDGLPIGGSIFASWTKLSGPGDLDFSDPNAATTSALFNTAGNYVLRLHASDGPLGADDDVNVTVNPPNQAPVVNAGNNQTITLPATANLDGSAIDDGFPIGSSLSVAWGRSSGPGQVTFANANSFTTSANFSAAGVYVLRLTANDGEEAASSEVTISVASQAVNQPPTVSAGPDQTISLPTDTVTLQGIATDDGLPSGNLTVAWSIVSGPATAVFGNGGSAETTAQFNATGTYVLRLTASDGELSRSDDLVVTVMPAPAQNQPPTANAGTDQTVLLSTGVQLDGSAGDDGLPAGNLTTNWTKISGPGAVTFLNPNVTITGALFSATGTYVLRLTAGDGALSASDEVTITVIENVAPPTISITTPTDGSSITEPIFVTGSVSNGAWVLEYSLDNDDNANNRLWTTFANGNAPVSNAELGTLDPTMMLNGLFDIRLSATDSYGQISRASIAVIVERNFKVGNFTVSFTDLNIPVASVPMDVTRTYDSRDKRVGDFGFGWSLGLHNIRLEKSGGLGFKWYETVSQELIPNYCLEATGSHLVTVTFPGGKVFKFQAAVTPHCQRFTAITSGTLTFIPLAGTHGTLEIVGSADFQIDGSVPGPVNLIGFGGGVDIFNSSLFKFTAEDGTAFVIDQRAGLQSIREPNNNTVTVSAGGIIHSNGKSITFNRDALGRISGVVDPAGNTQTYTYDAAGDLVSYTDNENNPSVYAYDANHRLRTIHDPRGIQPIRNDYDAAGRLISHTDGFGKVISYLHDIPGRVETITDRLGQHTRFEYDERGNVLSKTDARGGITSFTYDSNDNVLTETNALGKTTTNTYDPSDRRTSITDPLGNVTQFTHNALGKVLTTTDPLGRVTTNTYNAAGNLLTTRDALNNTTSFGYSVFDGQRTSMTDALSNITSYTYTGGYLTKETDALGHETTFSYDANGNRTSQTVKHTNALGQVEAITTSYEYDKLSRLRKTTFADGTFSQVEYNSIGQQSATIDQLGRRTEFTYDDMGRLARTTYADGAFEKTTYDAEGRRLTSKDRAGHVTSYTYDELGRLTKTTYADGTFTQTSYDPVGQALTTTDARGNVTRYFYDDAGRRTKVKNSLNQETSFTYDGNSNQLSMTDALGQTTSYEYDLDNRLTKTTYADATFSTVAYDALGRTVSRTDQAGKTTHFIYDAPGRLTKVKDALNQETTYAYDELGRQISQTDANNHTTRFEYDQLGRRLKRILPAGQFETYSYQSDGNLQSRTDFNGKTTTFTYDLMRRLLTKVPDPSLNQPTVSFTYNSVGQRSTMNDASGMTAYNYDQRNRLTSKQTPFGTLSYTYNEAGNLATTRSSTPHGPSVDYSYDALNRLETVKDNNLLALNGGVTNYTYDSVGNLQGYSYPNGVNSSYAYNSLNRLTTMTVGTSTSSLAGYSYMLGPAGNRTAVTELSGRTINYSYDDLYRLTGESIANDPHGINGGASYSYDPVGNRLNRSSSIAPVPSQSSTYDANDRLTGDSYDNNGNTISSGGNSYTYDFEDRLTALNGGSVTYAYDGDGNRIAKTVGGVTTNYLIDTNNPTGYAQVVEELQSGAVVKSFTYGHDLISQLCSAITANCSLSFYQYDGHGSVRQLTNASGSVTDAYDYDAFGNLVSRAGTTSNDYLYSGEQFDANLGFYYLRARYMNPASGRFLSTDVVEGNRFDPPTLHKYTYAENNPANLVDPRGEFSATESLASVVSSAISLSIQYQSLINAARLILAGLNLYLLATNETYRGNFFAGGPEFTSAAVADDLGSIAAAPARFSGSVFEASRLEPFAVRHATNYPQSVIDGINPGLLSADNRFAEAFYVAQDGQTAINEITSHGRSCTHVVRFEMNLSNQKVLDLTNGRVAQQWGYSSGLDYPQTQAIAAKATRARYSVIAFPAEHGAGTNFAVLDKFAEILRPMGVAPVP